MTDYDIVVVGAGPVGSTYAFKMACMGYSVALFDMKGRIGEPLQCAGLVSKNIDFTGNLPKEFIDNEVYGANLYAPDGSDIRVSKSGGAAYVINRVMYDKYLVHRAEDAGVDMFYSTRVKDVDIENTQISYGDRDKLSANIICVSCGPNSNTACKMNPNVHDESFLAVQYIVRTSNESLEYVDLNINMDVLPGFIWSIPVSPFEKRVGLFTNGSYKQASEILDKSLLPYDTIKSKTYGVIPKFNSKKCIVKNNTFLLGDAASQIKPTTGGGLIAGFNMADVAANNSDMMLKNGNNNDYLKAYEYEYHKMYDNEFKTQQNVQKLLCELSAEDYNYMFKILRERHVDDIISEYGDMDNQTQLIKELIKSGVIFKLLPKIGIRRLKNLWKSQ